MVLQLGRVLGPTGSLKTVLRLDNLMLFFLLLNESQILSAVNFLFLCLTLAGILQGFDYCLPSVSSERHSDRIMAALT